MTCNTSLGVSSTTRELGKTRLKRIQAIKTLVLGLPCLRAVVKRTERVQGWETPNSFWKASGSEFPISKGITDNSPHAVSIGAGGEGGGARDGAGQKDMGSTERLHAKGTHFLLAFKLLPWALPLLTPAGWEDLAGPSSGNKTERC